MNPEVGGLRKAVKHLEDKLVQKEAEIAELQRIIAEFKLAEADKAKSGKKAKKEDK